MHWSDSAIVLSVRRLGEHSGVVHLLTPEHGLAAGVDRGAFGSRRRGMYQPGNQVRAEWRARLPEQLGTLACELTRATAAQLLQSRLELAALTSATQLVQKMLSERERQPEIYAALEGLVGALCNGEGWMADYVRLEYTLLACTGFGLDLERCASTGQAHDLIYVSPRSGRAVSRQAGAPYHGRLLALPPFLHGEGQADRAQILDGLRLCGYFLRIRVFEPRGAPLPEARARFLHLLQPKEEHLGQTAC